MSRKNYYERLSTVVTEVIRRVVKTREKEFSDVMQKALAGDHSSKLQVNYRRDEQFAIFLFDGYSEIETSLGCLRDVEVYLRRFPYRNAKVPKSRYIAYHYEAYLNELYLLRERVDRHVTQMMRRYKKGSNGGDQAGRLLHARNSYLALLDPLLKPRGRHVHEKRFDHPDISRVRIIEMADSKVPRIYPRAVMSSLSRLLAKEVREEIRAQVDLVEAYTDELFEGLQSHIFTAHGLRYPWSLAKPLNAQ